jgi:hypothetical protein
MPLDVNYIGHDNEFEDGNYIQTSGCIPKVMRALAMEQCTVDGIVVGNGGYAALRREGNTASSRAKWVRYCQDVMRYFEETGQVDEVEIFAEKGSRGAVEWVVRFRDLTTNERAEVVTIPPWGA